MQTVSVPARASASAVAELGERRDLERLRAHALAHLHEVELHLRAVVGAGRPAVAVVAAEALGAHLLGHAPDAGVALVVHDHDR